jgi:hypothetical protein
MQTSTINVTIDLKHEGNLPLDAQGVAKAIASFLGPQLGLTGTGATSQTGRVAITGPEDGEHVRLFLNSAVFSRREELRYDDSTGKRVRVGDYVSYGDQTYKVLIVEDPIPGSYTTREGRGTLYLQPEIFGSNIVVPADLVTIVA